MERIIEWKCCWGLDVMMIPKIEFFNPGKMWESTWLSRWCLPTIGVVNLFPPHCPCLALPWSPLQSPLTASFIFQTNTLAAWRDKKMGKIRSTIDDSDIMLLHPYSIDRGEIELKTFSTDFFLLFRLRSSRCRCAMQGKLDINQLQVWYFTIPHELLTFDLCFRWKRNCV